MEKIDLSELHLTDWLCDDGKGNLSGGTAQTKEAIEMITEKINEIVEKLNS